MPKNCNAAYAYITLSTVSDHICQFTKNDVPLSAQEIIDCPKLGKGCKGGSVNQVLAWGKRKGFINERCYPMHDQTKKCPVDHISDNVCRANNNIYKVVDYCVAKGIDGIKREIMTNGPVIA